MSVWSGQPNDSRMTAEWHRNFIETLRPLPAVCAPRSSILFVAAHQPESVWIGRLPLDVICYNFIIKENSDRYFFRFFNPDRPCLCGLPLFSNRIVELSFYEPSSLLSKWIIQITRFPLDRPSFSSVIQPLQTGAGPFDFGRSRGNIRRSQRTIKTAV